MNKIELMAPVGNFESLMAAVENGADSIYFGIGQLNMRARSSINFEIDDLEKISKKTKEKGVKSYLTLNTIMYDHDTSFLKNILNQAKENDIDAVIASDHSVLAYANEIELPVHISTQVNITNYDSLKFYSKFADTVVLSRELSLNQIKTIKKQIEKDQLKGVSGKLMKLEIFGHGALCMAVSGKCYLSLHSHNSSANRGACKQNCRKKYKVIDQESGFEIEIDNEYMMSPKDLCTIDILDKIKDSGVGILKIEGRGRSGDYVAATTKCYREAIDCLDGEGYNEKSVAKWMEELKKVYNRGFWNGYYLGQKLGEWSDNPGSNATEKKIFLGKGKHYYSKSKIAEFQIESYDLNLGDKILIMGPTTGVERATVNSLFVNDKEGKTGIKGDVCAIPLDFKVRTSDKLYKVVDSNS